MANINGELIPFSENDIFAIPPKVPHFDYSDEGFTNYHFNFLDEEFSYKAYLKFHDTDDRIFKRIMKLLYKEFHLKRENYEKITDSLYDVLRNYIHSFSKQENVNPYITKIINSIISNMSDPNFNVNKAFNDVPLHKDYIRKLFSEETGMTPLQYLTHNRLICAKQLLINQNESHLTMKEIAHMSGYSDYYYFSRIFKKETGISPTDWVNSQKNLSFSDSTAQNMEYI